MKKVVLLGSTGSIGTSTVKVAEDLPGQIKLIALGAGNNVSLLLEQARKHQPQAVCISDPAKAENFKTLSGAKLKSFRALKGF